MMPCHIVAEEHYHNMNNLYYFCILILIYMDLLSKTDYYDYYLCIDLIGLIYFYFNTKQNQKLKSLKCQLGCIFSLGNLQFHA